MTRPTSAPLGRKTAGAQLRHRLFVLALLQDPKRDASKAAEAAGYSPRTAYAQGCRLLKDAAVQAELEKFTTTVTIAAIDRAAVDKARVLKELEALALSDIGEVMDFTGAAFRMKSANEIPIEARRALKSVKVKRYTEGRGENAEEVEVVEFAFWDKSDALVKLGRELGLTFPERHEHTGAGGGPMATAVVELTPDERKARVAAFLELQREGATP